MSLILEALKKLERDKQTGDRGFLVMAASPWPSHTRSRTGWIVAGVAVLVGLAGGGAWVLRGRVAPTASAVPPAPVSVAPAPAAALPTSTHAVPMAPLTAPVAAPKAPAPARLAQAEPVPAAGVAPKDAVPDPPRATPGTPLPPYRLTAISERDGRPVAVLNDRMVSEGEAFDGITILRIGDSEVEIEVNGQRRTVHF